MYREQLPFRDNAYRINFEDGRNPEYFTVYNGEITGWTDGVPNDLKDYGGHFGNGLKYKLAAMGLICTSEGPNE